MLAPEQNSAMIPRQFPDPAYPSEMPIYDIFWTPPYHIAILGPWYSRAMLNGLDIRIDGINPVFWQTPDPRMFTFVAKLEIPRGLRNASSWSVSLTPGRGSLPHLGAMRNVQRPGPSMESGRLAIATLAKYDAPYLSEWLRYHKAIGVGHVFLYNNGSTEISDVLSGFREFTTEIPWTYPYAMYCADTEPFWPANSHFWTQPAAQVHAALKYGCKFDWMAFNDVDEFLVPVKSESLIDVLNAVERHEYVEQIYHRPGAIQVRGKWFGTSYHEQLQKPVIQSYLRCEETCSSPVKAIVRPDAVVASAVHYFTVDGETIQIPDNVLRFNHYRSISDHQNRRGTRYDQEFTNASTDERALHLARKHRI